MRWGGDAIESKQCFWLLWNLSVASPHTGRRNLKCQNDRTRNETQYKQEARTFINNILSDFPSCKIVLLGLEHPSRNGLATNYNLANANHYADYIQAVNHVWNIEKWDKDLVDEYNGSVEYVNICGQFDSSYGFPTQEKYVNVRSTVKEIVQVNGVHPNESGYFEISDVCYMHFTNNLTWLKVAVERYTVCHVRCKSSPAFD